MTNLIYIVSGYPRSGTTAMMQALEAGGIEVVKNAARKEYLKHHDDLGFQARADYEPSIKERIQPSWPKQHAGKAVKAVAMWLPDLSVFQYRVVFMRRDAEEIRQSFEAAFKIIRTREQIETLITESIKGLKNRRDVISLNEIWYDNLLSNPQYELSKLGWPINYKKASKAIDVSKKRFDLQLLTVGA